MSRHNSRIPSNNNKPNTKKQRKVREKDPVKLVMAHGGAFKMVDDKPVPAPKGVVLGPVQAFALAQYIQKLNYLLQLATEGQQDEDGHTAEEVQEIVTGMEGQATDLSKLGKE